jgi:hypothetical protein
LKFDGLSISEFRKCLITFSDLKQLIDVHPSKIFSQKVNSTLQQRFFRGIIPVRFMLHVDVMSYIDTDVKRKGMGWAIFLSGPFSHRLTEFQIGGASQQSPKKLSVCILQAFNKTADDRQGNYDPGSW